MDDIFKKMYKEAIRNIDIVNISPFLSTGEIACVILSDENKLYRGINIIEDNKVKITAEEAAIASLLSNGGKVIKRIVIVNELGEVIKPSIQAYARLLDFAPKKDIDVLTSTDPFVVCKLKDLLPDFYGTFRVEEE